MAQMGKRRAKGGQRGKTASGKGFYRHLGGAQEGGVLWEKDFSRNKQ